MDITITQLTALYAALVATSTAAWTFYKDWNDKGKLRVSVGFKSIMGNGVIEENVLVWNITNVGKRSVLLTHAAGDTEENPTVDRGFSSFLVSDNMLPRRLEPGDYHASLCDNFSFTGPIKRLYATDSLSREFNAPRADVEQVNKTIKELGAKGITKSTKRLMAE